MIAGSPRALADAETEISALIEQLCDTEQRLEELTAGEVDSVSSRDGRTFLMRRAQQSLRLEESAKQAAILDALPSQVALLDADGVIIAVNAAWEDFAARNASGPVRCGAGVSYLQVCDSAQGVELADARNAAAGIRQVLDGSIAVFSLVYTCHSEFEQRWFHMVVSKLTQNQPGAVVTHSDVSAQRRADDALSASDQRFRQMAESIQDVFFLNDMRTQRLLYVSPAYERIWGRSCEELYADPAAWLNAIHPDDRAAVRENFILGNQAGTFEFGHRIVRPDGTIRVIEVRGFPVRDASGAVVRIAGVAEDVTERDRLEQAVHESERHFHFLDDLAQATRALSTPDQVVQVMTRMLGQHLKASRCAYATVNSDARQFTTLQCYTQDCISTVGTHDASAFGERAVQTLKSAQTLVLHDVAAELGEGEGAAAFAALEIRASITCPLVKEGRLHALMAVHQSITRNWTPAEIAVVEEVVERCWVAIERRTAEEKLRESEALLRIAGRTAKLGGWAVSVFGQDVTWSDEVCSILEVPAGTKPTLDQALSFTVPSERPRLSSALEACLQLGLSFDLDVEMSTATGRSIWVRCAGEARRNHVGVIVQARGAIQDITDEKAAEKVLQASMEEFRTLADAMPQIVWITRADGWCVYFNQHWESYTGVPLARSLGTDWVAVFHPDDQQPVWEAWQAATKTSGQYSIECRIRREDGSYRWWLNRGVPLRDADGRILKWFGTCTDIHDLKMAELANVETNRSLSESERRFSNMLGNVQLVSIMLDAGGRITYCNDYFLKLTGWQSGEVIGRDWFELFVPPKLRELRGVFTASLMDPPQSWHRENEIMTRTGELRLIRWNITVLHAGNGEAIGTASIGEDITESKQAELSIKYLNRVYSVLSGINTLIVRVRHRDELFKEACRIAVEAGGFRMAMICMTDPLTRRIVPVASAGKSEVLLEKVREVLSEPATASQTRVARAIREKLTIVSNDWLQDPGSSLHQDYVDAGVGSIAVLPLMVDGEALGVLALYANEPEFFHREEMKLLTELTNDIAFAIDHIAKGERLSFLAYYDSLTGLANRALFHELLTQNIKTAAQQGTGLAVVVLDIERFRTVNDTFGRKKGDLLLQELSARLKVISGSVIGIARIDADHFALLLNCSGNEQEISHEIDQQSAEVFGLPFHIGDTELRMSARFGVAVFPGNGGDADALFSNAEAALKNAKSGPDRCLFYTLSMNERVAEKLVLENQLRQALERDEFVLHYQPKIDLMTGKLTGCEALIRWNDPHTGLVPPGKFIPILEETGLIFEVGRWALRQAIADGLRWRRAGLQAVRVAVNVSPLQLRNRGFVAEIQKLISVDERAALSLELEITEGMIMEDMKNSIASLQELRALGVTIAIDDFGTGFSSLSYLARLPVDTLKIDRSFVNDMTSGPVGLALVSTIVTLAHSVKLRVVAEGVETEEQSRLLRLLMCDEMQGFLIARPMPADDFEAKFLICA